MNKPSALPYSLVRIGFGIIWLIDASFKWSNTFISNYLNILTSAAGAQPSFLHNWYAFWINLISISPTSFAYTTAVVETLTAIGLILGFGKKIGYLFAGIFCLLIWSTAEGFGGPYTTGSTDVGAGIIYAIVFLLFFVSSFYVIDRFGIDTIISKKITWWKYIS